MKFYIGLTFNVSRKLILVINHMNIERGMYLTLIWRQRGRVVRALDLKSGDPVFKSRPDHQLDLFQGVRGSTPRLRLYIANWSASCQLGFLTC